MEIKTFQKRLLRLFILLSVGIILAGCASQPTTEVNDAPGFFMGFIHGFCVLFSLIGSVFMDVRIYAYPNSGILYDIGFFFGASAFLGGGGVGASKAGKNS